MKRSRLLRTRLLVLGLFGLPLMSYPLLALPGGEWAGIPATYLYLFGVWAGLIALATRIAEGPGR